MRWQTALAVLAVLATSACAAKKQAKVRVPKVPPTTGLVATSGAAGKPSPLPPMMRQQVLNAVNAGDGDGQILVLRRQMEADPNNLAVRLQLAAAYGQRNLPELEIEHCRLAAEKWPASGEAATALAKAYMKAGLPQQALARLRKWLATGDTASDGDTNSTAQLRYVAWAGILFDEAGELQEGEQAFRRAIAIDGKQDYLHNNLGQNLLRQGKLTEAATSFRQALALQPASRLARNNLAVALVQQAEKGDKGAELRQEALSLFLKDGDEAAAHNNLALSLLEAGQTKAARQEMELALRYQDKSSLLRDNLYAVAEADGDPVVLPDTGGNPMQRFGARIKGWFGSSSQNESSGSSVKKVKTKKAIAVPPASR